MGDGRWETATAFELLVEEKLTDGAVLREGQDFVSQDDLINARPECKRTVLSPLAGRLVVLARADALWPEVRDGRAGAQWLGDFPAWRVDLWRCLWS